MIERKIAKNIYLETVADKKAEKLPKDRKAKERLI